MRAMNRRRFLQSVAAASFVPAARAADVIRVIDTHTRFAIAEAVPV